MSFLYVFKFYSFLHSDLLHVCLPKVWPFFHLQIMKTLPLPFQSHLFYYQVNKFIPLEIWGVWTSSQSLSPQHGRISIIFESISTKQCVFSHFSLEVEDIFVPKPRYKHMDIRIYFIFIYCISFLSFSFFSLRVSAGPQRHQECHNFLQMVTNWTDWTWMRMGTQASYSCSLPVVLRPYGKGPQTLLLPLAA